MEQIKNIVKWGVRFVRRWKFAAISLGMRNFVSASAKLVTTTPSARALRAATHAFAGADSPPRLSGREKCSAHRSIVESTVTVIQNWSKLRPGGAGLQPAKLSGDIDTKNSAAKNIFFTMHPTLV